MESYIFNFSDYQDLNLLEIGDQQCTPLYSFGPYIRNEYIFHYVLSGKGYISYAPSTCSDNKILTDISGSIEINAGEGFLFEPHSKHIYHADEKEPWHYIWILFKGLSVPQYLRACGLNHGSPVYRPKDYSAQTTTSIKEHLSAILQHPHASKAYIIGHLHLFFDTLIKNAAGSIKSGHADIRIADLYISEAVRYIGAEYAAIRSLDEISSYCNVSRSHLTKLFRANLHMSLQEYLIQFRINKSLDLLASTNLPVYQIAYHVGYENELNFLRAFKKQMGMSPSTWRKQNKL